MWNNIYRYLVAWYTLQGRFVFFFFKQKTAYEMRISDWSSDVCSSDLYVAPARDDAALDEAESAEGRSSDIGDYVGNIACRPARRARSPGCRFFVGRFFHHLPLGLGVARGWLFQAVTA